LPDKARAERYIAQVKRCRTRFADEVKYPVLTSDANFVMIDVARTRVMPWSRTLPGKGIVVRSCRSFAGMTDHYIRVSVGEDWENELFVQENQQL